MLKKRLIVLANFWLAACPFVSYEQACSSSSKFLSVALDKLSEQKLNKVEILWFSFIQEGLFTDDHLWLHGEGFLVNPLQKIIL